MLLFSHRISREKEQYIGCKRLCGAEKLCIGQAFCFLAGVCQKQKQGAKVMLHNKRHVIFLGGRKTKPVADAFRNARPFGFVAVKMNFSLFIDTANDWFADIVKKSRMF